MDYIPRYSQPFTLQEARQLEVPIITEEISRLQNSLAHLRRTQDELKDTLSAAPGDPDLTEAFEENEVVIGSQTERISMLRIVLGEKGVSATSTHYHVGAQSGHQTPSNSANSRGDTLQTIAGPLVVGQTPTTGDGEEGGIYL